MLIKEAEIAGWIVLGIVAAIIIYFLFFMWMVTRYRKFNPNQYVIHLRNGKILHEGIGGSLWLLPLIDEYIVIPLMNVNTIIKSGIPLDLKGIQRIIIESNLVWKVIDAQKSFKELSWFQREENYAENIIKITLSSIIKRFCDKKSPEQIIEEKISIIEEVVVKLTKIAEKWGILIVSYEIKDVYIETKYEHKELMGIKL